jgi:succinate dehydrogenase / fumarate reductase cytochrome b subunit
MKKLVGRELSVRVIKRRRMVWPLKFKTFALSKTSWESGCLKNSRYRSTHGEDLNSSAEEAPLTAGRPGFSKLPLEDRITSGGRNGADDAGRGSRLRSQYPVRVDGSFRDDRTLPRPESFSIINAGPSSPNLPRRGILMIYRGGVGQWAYFLHRLTGIGILLFLLVHIVDTFIVRVDPDMYTRLVRDVYAAAWFKPFEVALAAAVLYHALNGVRIILVDFWDIPSVYHKRLLAILVFLFILLFLPGMYFLLRPIFS